MAADLACLDDVAAGGPPVLRLYRWSPPALSLGRFQPEDDVDREACHALGVEVVRRPTGGRALLHGGDLTYAVALCRPIGRGGPRRRALPDARRRAGRRAGRPRGARSGRARPRARGPGVLRVGAGRGPAGGGPEALRVGPGPARRQRAPARLGSARAPPVRRARPPHPAAGGRGAGAGPSPRAAAGEERHAGRAGDRARPGRRPRRRWSRASRGPSTSSSTPRLGGVLSGPAPEGRVPHRVSTFRSGCSLDA